METTKVYSMVYDNPERGNNGLGEFLGEFRKVKQIREDTYVDDFIGVNIANGEVCMILSREVCGYGGGIKYEVIPIPELMERDDSNGITQIRMPTNSLFPLVDEDGYPVL